MEKLTCDVCGLSVEELHNIWGCCNTCNATASFISDTKRIPKSLAFARLKHAIEETADKAKLPKNVQDAADYVNEKSACNVTKVPKGGTKPGGSPKVPRRLYRKTDGGFESMTMPLSSEDYRKLEYTTNDDEGIEAFRSKKELLQYLYALADVALMVGDQKWLVEIAKESKRIKEMK